MAYIAPNSIIKVLKGVPLNNTYVHTMYWSSKQEQYNAISTYAKYTLNAYSYQRASQDQITVAIPADNIMDCNYLMFQNTSYSNKWFYAFITNVEYVNNDTARITYELDVIQTWWGDFVIGPNFVERMHSPTDTLFENLVDENIDAGDYVCVDETINGTTYYDWTAPSTNWKIVFAAGWTAEKTNNIWSIDRTQSGGKQGCVFTGIRYTVCDDVDDAVALINTAIENTAIDDILCVFMVPSAFIHVQDPTNYPHYYQTYVIDNANYVAQPDNTLSVGGYVPRNKKLYTYPFSKLVVTDGGEQEKTYRYEFMDYTPVDPSNNKHSAKFSLLLDFGVNPTAAFVPIKYRRMANKATDFGYHEPSNAVVMGSFPCCAINVDGFKAYLAQTLGPAAAAISPERTNTFMDIAGITKSTFATSAGIADALSGFTRYQGAHEKGNKSGKGKDVSLVPDGVSGVLNSISNISTAAMSPNIMIGKQTDTNGVNFGFKGFRIYKMSVTSERAAIIDSYFDMYGYAYKRVVNQINLNTRPMWNYIQLKNAYIKGDIPFDHEGKICDILNNGITFWHNINYVGDYSQNNLPT